jgi:hypothetical protein
MVTRSYDEIHPLMRMDERASNTLRRHVPLFLENQVQLKSMKKRTATAHPMEWRFTNEDVRLELKKFYPGIKKMSTSGFKKIYQLMFCAVA